MATPTTSIDALPAKTGPTGAELLIVQDTGITKKMPLSELGSLSSAALTAHLADDTDAHDASAISATTSGTGVDGPNVQVQLGQLAGKVNVLEGGDVMWVGTDTPPDPKVEVWWDTNETSASVLGVATNAETIAGTATDLAVTPAGLKASRLDVRSFGAVGDGVTDDRAAVQAAMDAAGAGGVVYFPRGTYLLTSATDPLNVIVKTYPGQTLSGAGRYASVLKVGPSFGNYKAVVSVLNPSTYTGNWSMQDLGIDQNAAGGNALDIPNMATYAKFAVRAGSYTAGDSVTIRGCWFGNGDTVNTLYIYADTLDVHDNHFTGIGGAAAYHDHSTIYTTTTINAGVQNVIGNVFQGLGGHGAFTAIETHGGTQVVVGNTVSGMFTGANLTGYGGTITTNGITCTGNSIVGCVIGFSMWSGTPAGQPTRSVNISNNTVTIDREAWAALTGVGTNVACGVRLGLMAEAIDGLTINGNVITYQPITTTKASDYQSAGISLNASGEIRNFQVCDNTIIRPLSAGINLSMTLKRGRVSGNLTVDPLSSSEPNTVYASCVMLGATVEDLKVENNTMVDTRTPHLGSGFCVYSNPTAANGICEARGNATRLVDGAAAFIPFYPAANTAGAAFYVEDKLPSDGVPFFNTKKGSNWTNSITGKKQTQVTAPTGVAFMTEWFGTGSPENVVLGVVGSRYYRTDGAAGSTFYVKESGAGTNTGWVGK